jgi:hypothetical protein
MAISVQGPDGSTVDFPDDTDPGTITSVMQQNFGGPSGSPTTSTSGDSEAGKTITQKGLDALKYGGGQMVQGLASTSKVLGGPDYTNEVAALGTNGGTYTPASTGLFDKSKGWMERLGFLPRFLAEQVPQVGGMVAADALTGGIGGPALIAGSTLGPGVQAAQEASGNATPSTMDYVKGIGNAGVQAGLAKVGFGGASGAIGSTADSALAKAAGIAKAAGTGALAVGAGDLANKGIIEGQLPSADELATSALAGGVGAGALRGIGEAVPSRPTLKFADIDPANGANLAEHFNGLDTSTPEASYEAVNQVEGKLQNLIKTEPDTQAQLNFLEKQPGYDADIRQKLNGVRDQLKDGQVVDPQAISDIGDALRPIAPVGDEPQNMVARQSDKLVQSLQDYNSLNKVKLAGAYDPQAGTFGNKVTTLGAIANSKALTPRWNPYHMGLEGMALHYLTGMAGVPSVAVAAGIPAAQAIVRSGVRGLDGALGMRSNPLEQFTSRFGGAGDTRVPMGPVDTSSVDNLINPQEGVSPLTTQAPQAPAAPQAPVVASQSRPLAMAGAAVNFRDVLAGRQALAKAQAISDKQEAQANGLAAKVAPQLSGLADNGSPLSMLQASQALQRVQASQARQAKAARAPIADEAQVSPETSDTPITGDTISTKTKSGNTVTADASQVANPKQWRAAVAKREAVRDGVIAEAKAEVDHDPVAVKQLDQIRSDMTNQSLPTQEAAKTMVDKHLKRMAPRHRAAVHKVLHSHALMSTYHP